MIFMSRRHVSMKSSEKFLDDLTRASARYILGETTGIKIQGSKARIKATRSVLNASRNLYVELIKEDADLDLVLNLMRVKKEAAREFHQVTGLRWRL